VDFLVIGFTLINIQNTGTLKQEEEEQQQHQQITTTNNKHYHSHKSNRFNSVLLHEVFAFAFDIVLTK